MAVFMGWTFSVHPLGKRSKISNFKRVDIIIVDDWFVSLIVTKKTKCSNV